MFDAVMGRLSGAAKYISDPDHLKRRLVYRYYNIAGYVKDPMQLVHKYRARHDSRQLLGGVEKARDEILARGITSQDDYSKYLDIGRYVTLNMRRAYSLGLDQGGQRRILDLGCGAGYFVFVCRQLGHDAVGLDLDCCRLFNEMVDALDIPRIVQRIEPGQPLRCEGRFDLVTAFAACFHAAPDDGSSIWGEEEWRFFIEDTKANVLTDGGRLVLEIPDGDNREFATTRRILRTLGASRNNKTFTLRKS